MQRRHGWAAQVKLNLQQNSEKNAKNQLEVGDIDWRSFKTIEDVNHKIKANEYDIKMNPFEIRAQMLSMAQDYLQQQQEINLDFAGRTFEQLLKEGKKVAEDWQTYAPKMYTFEDVLKEANKLYGFVKDVK